MGEREISLKWPANKERVQVNGKSAKEDGAIVINDILCVYMLHALFYYLACRTMLK